MRIQNNVPALNAHRFYTINNNGMTKSIAKLSSGYRINSAADDAAGLAISEKMRAQIRGLTMASKNAQDATSLIQTAEGGMQEIDNMIQRIRELVDYAANDTQEHNAYMTGDRQKIQDEINQLTQEIDAMADRVEFNKKKLLNGDVAGIPTKGAATLNAAINAAKDALKTQQSNYSTKLQDFKNATTGAQSARDVFNSVITDTNITEYLKKISETGGTSVDGAVKDVMDAVDNLKEKTSIADTYAKVANLGTDVGTVESKMSALRKAVESITSTDASVQSKEQATAALENLEKLLGNNAYVGKSALRSAFEGTGTTSPLGVAKNAFTSAFNNVKNILKQLTELDDGYTYDSSLAGITFSGSPKANQTTMKSELNTLASQFGDLNSAVTKAQWDAAFTALTQTVSNLTALNGETNNSAVTVTTALAGITDSFLADGTTAMDVANLEGSVDPGDASNQALLQTAKDAQAAAQKYVTDQAAYLTNLTAAIGTLNGMKAGALTTANADLTAEVSRYATANKVPTAQQGQIKLSDVSKETTGLVNRYREYNKANVDLTTALGSLNGAKSNFAIAQQDLAAAPKEGGLYFQIGANANQGAQLYINSIKSDKLGIGDGNGISLINVLDDTGMNITAQLDTLDTALSYVTTERAKLGAAQNRMEYTMNSLDVSAENLTAAESRIRDVDMAKEMSNFTRQNILFQASTAMLAQANSMPQGVLQLLG